jgi:hypothetical protein
MCASAAALRRAEDLCRRFKPHLAEMIERNDPSVEGLTFDDIEADSAAVGDLVSRLAMLDALARQGTASKAEVAEARLEAFGKAEADLAAGKRPGELRMTRQRDKPRRLKTIRGEIRFSREYLHFPDLKTGVFPPR